MYLGMGTPTEQPADESASFTTQSVRGGTNTTSLPKTTTISESEIDWSSAQPLGAMKVEKVGNTTTKSQEYTFSEGNGGVEAIAGGKVSCSLTCPNGCNFNWGCEPKTGGECSDGRCAKLDKLKNWTECEGGADGTCTRTISGKKADGSTVSVLVDDTLRSE